MSRKTLIARIARATKYFREAEHLGARRFFWQKEQMRVSCRGEVGCEIVIPTSEKISLKCAHDM